MTTTDLKPGMLLVNKYDESYLILPYGPGYIGGYSMFGKRIDFDRNDIGKNLIYIYKTYGFNKVYDIPEVGSILGENWFDPTFRKLVWDADNLNLLSNSAIYF